MASLNETPSLANYEDTVVVNLAIGDFLHDAKGGMHFLECCNT